MGLPNPNQWAKVAAQLIENGSPILGGILGGPVGSTLGSVIGNLVGQALGVPPTPAAISAAIALDPTVAAEKLKDVESKHAELMEEFQATIKDIADARSQTVELAKTGSNIAWGAPVVSVVGLGGFVLLALLAVAHGIANDPMLQMIVSTFRDIAIYVVSYWLGSSFGSRNKDATIDTITSAIASIKK